MCGGAPTFGMPGICATPPPPPDTPTHTHTQLDAMRRRLIGVRPCSSSRPVAD